MAIYAIGDIQGCYDSLRRLLDQCAFDPAQDRLWLVGDLVNRGPSSLETLRFVRSLGTAATTVLGNHDLYLLMLAADLAPKRGKDDTLGPILKAPDRDELLLWLRQQPLCHLEELDGQPHLLVHAGVLPMWSAKKARKLAKEVEDWLQGDDYRDLLANMWGSEPARWDKELKGWKRLRVIINAMTRMRFCTPDGEMEFKVKGELRNAPAGYLPWFALPNRRTADTVLVTGHWSALGLRIEPTLLALDSGCLWGNHLTAMRLPQRQLFQVPCSPLEAQPLSAGGD